MNRFLVSFWWLILLKKVFLDYRRKFIEKHLRRKKRLKWLKKVFWPALGCHITRKLVEIHNKQLRLKKIKNGRPFEIRTAFKIWTPSTIRKPNMFGIWAPTVNNKPNGKNFARSRDHVEFGQIFSVSLNYLAVHWQLLHQFVGNFQSFQFPDMKKKE